MRTWSTFGASIADSEMNLTFDLDNRRMAGETYSLQQIFLNYNIIVCVNSLNRVSVSHSQLLLHIIRYFVMEPYYQPVIY